jgi:hypothetical protein
MRICGSRDFNQLLQRNELNPKNHQFRQAEGDIDPTIPAISEMAPWSAGDT